MGYHYLTQWSEADGVFVGQCYEFPSLRAHGDNHDSAREEIESVVALAVEDLRSEGEPVPPVSTDTETEIRRVLEARFVS